jgi:hypothetical protein
VKSIRALTSLHNLTPVLCDTRRAPLDVHSKRRTCSHYTKYIIHGLLADQTHTILGTRRPRQQAKMHPRCILFAHAYTQRSNTLAAYNKKVLPMPHVQITSKPLCGEFFYNKLEIQFNHIDDMHSLSLWCSRQVHKCSILEGLLHERFFEFGRSE